MKLNFLCPRHREWLSANPSAARNVWLNAELTGRDALEAGNYPEAVRQLGCALDAAQLLLDGGPVPRSEEIRRLGSTAGLFIHTLYGVEAPDAACQVNAWLLGWLERCLQRGAPRDAVFDVCQILHSADADECERMALQRQPLQRPLAAQLH